MADKGKILLDYTGKLLGAKLAFNGMSALNDAANIPIDGPLCYDILNCDIDNRGNISRRDGLTLITNAVITSVWSNGTYVYCVSGGKICTYNNATTITPLVNSPTVNVVTEFKQVNNVVVYSDGTNVGIIEGTTLTAITTSTTFANDAAIASHVTTNLPANFQAAASNFEVDAFKLTTPAGRCLEFYDGKLYFAINNYLYCTKTFDVEHIDIRYNVVAGFPTNITMVAKVTDGLYVGTADGTYFLSGSATEQGGFSQEQISKFGVIYGSNITYQSENSKATEGVNINVYWTSTNGIYSGTSGGKYKHLSEDQVNMSLGTTATALLKTFGETQQYIVCFNADGNDTYPTWVVNTDTSAHSRYSKYTFKSLYTFNNLYYGVNANGVYQLIGEDDFGSTIDAFAQSPITDFEKTEIKAVMYAYLNLRADGDIGIDFIIDEEIERSDYMTNFDYKEGSHRRKFTFPKGLKGTNWQFKIKNINGSYFKLFDFELKAATLKRNI